MNVLEAADAVGISHTVKKLVFDGCSLSPKCKFRDANDTGAAANDTGAAAKSLNLLAKASSPV